ncbi:MAG: FkbM family methyltransferase [Coleofasciculus sp.]|uniref:FkbM family methyltransferase n=1 Tax=Coleofasciculus sp. TaxID=3100458 RepID=UPI003A4AAE9D
MDSYFHPIDSYWNYLKRIGLTLDSAALSYVTASLEKTDWDEPTSAIELNNVAVVALIEAEQSQDSSVRLLYFEMAVEALNQGVELYGHPLCAAHLALVYGMTGETGQGIQMAFSTFIQSLMPAYVEESVDSGIVYLPPGNYLIDSRAEKLAEILGTENGYTQSLLLLSEVLCYSVLVFYNVAGLRFLHLAAQLYPESAAVNLKLGISSLTNNQQEGLFYLHRARKLEPERGNILQALYLAYRDLGQMESARVWRRMGAELSQGASQGLEWYWTRLVEESQVSYVPFENQLLLAVEPSLRSIVTSVLITEGDWFEKEMEFWRRWIKPGMTVIDVGANVGVYTFSAALRVGTEGRVLAVEPFSGCVRCLQETCKINQLDWVKVCAGAASDHQGMGRLALQATNELNQIVEGEGERMQQGTLEEVRCFTLDSLVEEEDISQIDLLKIDAEGHEVKVLAGSSRILTEFKPCIMYENIAGSQGANLAVADFLRDRGYQLFQYKPFLEQLLPIESTEDLSGRLNLIAVVDHKTLK